MEARIYPWEGYGEDSTGFEEDDETVSLGHETDPSVLVVVVNSSPDWEIVLHERWYRLPVKKAPQQIGAEYLAFYLTAGVGDGKWAVSHYAPLVRCRLSRRRELLPSEADHPRAGELYYRLDIGPMQSLTPPLPSRRLRRITFIHTTLPRLLEAQDVKELWITPSLRERLWVEMNRQGIHAERDIPIQMGTHRRQVDFVIPCHKGAVAVECLPCQTHDRGPWREAVAPYPRTADEGTLEEEGWSCLRFQEAGWPYRIDYCLDALWEKIGKQGGQL